MSGAFEDPRLKAIAKTAGAVVAIDSVRSGGLALNSNRLMSAGFAEGVHQYFFRPYIQGKVPSTGNPLLDKVLDHAAGYGLSASAIDMVQGGNANLMGNVMDGAIIAVANEALAKVINL